MFDRFRDALALLVYCAPFLPLLAPLLFRRASHARFRRNCWSLLFLVGIQTLSFVPFWVAWACVGDDDEGLALPWLLLAYSVGVLIFISTLIYSIGECRRLRALLRSPLPV